MCKRILTLALCFIMLFSFVACNGGDEPVATTEAETTTSPATTATDAIKNGKPTDPVEYLATVDYNKFELTGDSKPYFMGRWFEKEIDGVRYELEENPMGWKWFQFDFEGETGKLTYENTRGVKTIAFGCNSLLEGTFPETHFYDKQVETPSNRELDCMSDLSWTEEKKILLRTYITDVNFGSCFITFGFKGEEVGVMMNQRGEFFLRDYAGFAGGVVIKNENK